MFESFKNIFKRQAIVATQTQFDNTVVWPERNYENFARETYLKNVISFRSIDIIAKAVASVEWDVYSKDGDGRKLNLDHPLNKIITRPNPDESFSSLMLKATAFTIISGNNYFQKVALERNNEIRELYVLRPDRVSIKIDNGRKSGYVHKIGSKETEFKIDPLTGQSDVLQVKLFHPLDDLYGAAVTESVAREIDTSNEATKWNKSLLENKARPGMIFSFPSNLSDKQYNNLKKQLIENYSGAKNAGKNLILEGSGGASVHQYSLTPSEMDWSESSRELSRRIAFGYGVPPQLIGIQGDSTYSNYSEARSAFWEETVFFYLQLFKSELNNWISKEDDNVFIDYNLDKIPAMAPKRKMLFDMANTATFLTENEKREMVGRESIDGLDIILKPMNLLPIGEDIDTDEDDMNEDDNTND